MLRRTLTIATAAAGLTLAPFAAPAFAAPPTNMGAVSGPARATGYPTLRDVRWATHDTYDRIVFEFSGGTPGYKVAYGTLDGLGTGDAVALAGNGDLIVDFEFARAHDDSGKATYPLTTRDMRLPTLLQLKWGGDYEGYVRAGLGLREKVGFRVTRLSSPGRIVIDVSHFGTLPITKNGTASNVVVDRHRAAKQTGWDRLVFDVRGTAKPDVVVRYSADTSLLLVKISGTTATYLGAAERTYGLPGIQKVRFGSDTGGDLLFRVATTHRYGFRVSVLTNPIRVVVDVAH